MATGNPWYHAEAVCTCPVAWWGIHPPPCPVHNPSGSWTAPTITLPFIIPADPAVVPKPATEKGWECPRCTRINAPHTPFCCKEK